MKNRVLVLRISESGVHSLGACTGPGNRVTKRGWSWGIPDPINALRGCRLSVILACTVSLEANLAVVASKPGSIIFECAIEAPLHSTRQRVLNSAPRSWTITEPSSSLGKLLDEIKTLGQVFGQFYFPTPSAPKQRTR